jgi:tRNA U34 2-thiouridine synthase MnmA/TrmU
MIGIYHQPGHYFRTESYQNRKNNEQAQTYVIVKLSPENIRAVRLKLQHLL